MESFVNMEIDILCKRISNLVEEVIVCHKIFSEQHLENISSKNMVAINLKTKQIREIVEFFTDDGIFWFLPEYYEYINWYMYLLNDLTAMIDFEYDYLDIDCRTRVKQNESMVNKIIYYCVGKNEKGKVSLNKCLNDLFGLRITIGNYDLGEIHERMEYYLSILRQKYGYKLKISNATKSCYTAIHIYIQGDNNYVFPWELQIWNIKDREKNEGCHKKYKQQYVEWAEIFRKTGIKEKGE